MGWWTVATFDGLYLGAVQADNPQEVSTAWCEWADTHRKKHGDSAPLPAGVSRAHWIDLLDQAAAGAAIVLYSHPEKEAERAFRERHAKKET